MKCHCFNTSNRFLIGDNAWLLVSYFQGNIANVISTIQANKITEDGSQAAQGLVVRWEDVFNWSNFLKHIDFIPVKFFLILKQRRKKFYSPTLWQNHFVLSFSILMLCLTSLTIALSILYLWTVVQVAPRNQYTAI